MHYYGQETSEKIIDIFQKYRMPTTDIDEWDKGGSYTLLRKINQFVLNGKQVEFAMLGFPFKSTNTRDKVIGTLPDLGEEIAFKNFGDFTREVSKVYTPGARISVVSDGLIFNDILNVPESLVESYHEYNTQWSSENKVQLLSMKDFFNKKSTLDSMRSSILNNFGIDEVELQRRILFDPNVNQLYRGMKRFMEQELAINSYPSRNQLDKAAKILTREAMLRNEAYSQFMAHELSERTPYIRLSMHQSTNNGTKYSFQLVPGKNAHHSPWHSAIALENGQYHTIHRKDAEAKGYELVEKDGRPYFYQGNCLIY